MALVSLRTLAGAFQFSGEDVEQKEKIPGPSFFPRKEKKVPPGAGFFKFGADALYKKKTPAPPQPLFFLWGFPD